MSNDTKVITIQSEDDATYKDVMLAYIVPKKFNESIIENFLENFKKEEHDDYWNELEKSITELFSLNNISFECYYIY